MTQSKNGNMFRNPGYQIYEIELKTERNSQCWKTKYFYEPIILAICERKKSILAQCLAKSKALKIQIFKDSKKVHLTNV